MKEHFLQKIKNNSSDLEEVLGQCRSAGRKLVFTNGCFDILHTGHLQYLQEARDLGDLLIIGVNDDSSVKRLKGKLRPILHLKERMEMLAALQMVDFVVPFSEDTPARLIGEILPDVLVKGGDYVIEEIVGAKEVISNGGVVKVLGFKDGVSTTNIIEVILKRFNDKN